MGRKRDISPTRVSQMVASRNEGVSQRIIAKRLQCSQSTVSKCLERFDATNSYKARKRPSRQICTTVQTDRLIKRLAVTDLFITARQIASALPLGCSPHVRTIQRRFRYHCKLKSCRPAMKPFLSKKTFAIDLIFAANTSFGSLMNGVK